MCLFLLRPGVSDTSMVVTIDEVEKDLITHFYITEENVKLLKDQIVSSFL